MLEFVDQHRAHLRVAVLLDDEHRVVLGDETLDRFGEREGAHAHRVDVHAIGLEHVAAPRPSPGWSSRSRSTPKRVFCAAGAHDRLRHQLARGLELAQQALHVVDVVGAGLGVAGVAVLRGAAREVGALGRVRAGIGAERDAVAVDVEVAAEVAAGLEFRGRHHLAAVVGLRVVPGRAARDRRWFMPMSRSVITNTGVCRRSARSSACAVNSKHSCGSSGQQQHVLGVAVRGVGAGDQVGLLRAGRHAGGRAAALHVDDRDRDLGEVGQADELGHQRHARAGGGGECARAVPAGADDHADRSQLVLGLHDRERCSCRFPCRRAASSSSSGRPRRPTRTA